MSTTMSVLMNVSHQEMGVIVTVPDDTKFNFFRNVFVLMLYLVTGVLAVLGNMFVCVVIKQKRWLKSATYVLIYSMAISDILGGATILLQMLFCSTYMMDNTPWFGELNCGILKTLQMLSYYVSSLTMLAVAYDRYRLVCRPMGQRVSIAFLLVPCWLFGVFFVSANFLAIRVSEYFSPTEGLITCRVVFQTTIGFKSRKIRAIILMITQYILPLSLTAVFYSQVMRTIWSREHITGSKSQEKQQQFDEKKKRTIVMLMVVTVLFALSYIPTHVYHLLMFYTKVIPLHGNKCYSATGYMLGYWLGVSSCAYNPFIYCYFNAEFRREAHRWWIIAKSCGRVTTLPINDQQTSGLAPSSTDSTFKTADTDKTFQSTQV